METTKDSLLYAIEVSESMLKHGTLKEALNAACDSIRERMASYPADNTGILLYGVSDAKDHCKVLLDLKPQDSHGVKLLFRLLEDESFFEQQIQPSGEGTTALSDVFFQAGVMFEQEKAKSYRRLVIITDNDEPHEPKSRLAEVAKIKSYDLVQKNVTIVPVFIKPPGGAFEVAKLWEDFYFTPEFYIDSSQVKLEPINGTPDDILEAVTRQEVPRRPAFRNQILLGDLSIDVRGFILYKMQAVGQTYNVAFPDGKAEVATPHTQYIVEESGREVEKSEMSRAYDFGKTRLVVDSDQIDELRDFGNPGIRILGFQDRSDNVTAGHLGHSLFLYPWDVYSTGSVRAFIALWRSLLKGKRMAIVQCVLRANSTPCIGALYASDEAVALDGHQKLPPGLHLVFLPYMDDVRDIPQDTIQLSAPDEVVDAMGAVVEKLTMPQGYNPMRYRNPKLLYVSSVIEAQALSREMPQVALDGTWPKYRSISTRGGEAISAVNTFLIQKDEEVEEKSTSPQKRHKNMAQ